MRYHYSHGHSSTDLESLVEDTQILLPSDGSEPILAASLTFSTYLCTHLNWSSQIENYDRAMEPLDVDLSG